MIEKLSSISQLFASPYILGQAPSDYGLTKSTMLESYNGGIALVMNRKSRIVMADGQRILVKVAKLRERAGDVPIVLKTSAPVCSKTIRFLEGEGVLVIAS